MINPYTIFIWAFILLALAMFLPGIISYARNRKSFLIPLSIENKKILEKLSKSREGKIKIDELKLKNKNEFWSSLDWLKSKKLIYIRGKNIFITDKGKEKLWELYSEKYKDIDKKNEFLSNLMIALIMVFIAFATFQIQITQTQILESTSQPLSPKVEYRLLNPEYDSIHYISQIKGIYPPEENSTGKPIEKKIEEFTLYAVNYGKTSTGTINLDVDSYDEKLGLSIDSISLDSENSVFNDIRFWAKGCTGGDIEYLKAKEECEKSKLEPGIKEIFIEIKTNYENPKCYSFKMCLTNYTLEANRYCELNFNKEDFKLNPVNCPEDLF